MVNVAQQNDILLYFLNDIFIIFGDNVGECINKQRENSLDKQ